MVDKKITIIDQPVSKASDTISSFGSVTKSDTTYTLSTTKGSVSQFNLEKSLGLDSGILDATNGNENATEGSAISAVFAVKSGDILTFDYYFQGGDYLPYDDFAFVSVNGQTSTFSSIGEVGSYGTEAGIFKLEITDDLINDDGTIAVSVGVMDVGDTAMDTSLVVKDLALNKEEYIDDDIDIDDDLMIEDDSKNTINVIGDYSQSDDGDTYFLSTGSGSESQFTLESTLGLKKGTLDKTNGKANATEGSAVYAELNAKAGDVVTFDYFFDGGDYLPFDDFAFVSINGKSITLASIKENGNYGDESGVFEYKLKSTDVKGGTVKVAVGVMDVGDTAVTSALAVSGLSVTPADYVDEDVDIDTSEMDLGDAVDMEATYDGIVIKKLNTSIDDQCDLYVTSSDITQKLSSNPEDTWSNFFEVPIENILPQFSSIDELTSISTIKKTITLKDWSELAVSVGMNLDATGDINSDGFEGVVVKASLNPESSQYLNDTDEDMLDIGLLDPNFIEYQVFEYDPTNPFPTFSMNMGEILPEGIWQNTEKPEVVYIDIKIAAVAKYSSNIESTFKASVGSTNVSSVFSENVPIFDADNITKTYDLSAYNESLNQLLDDSGVVALTTDSQILDILESDINVANSYKFKKNTIAYEDDGTDLILGAGKGQVKAYGSSDSDIYAPTLGTDEISSSNKTWDVNISNYLQEITEEDQTLSKLYGFESGEDSIYLTKGSGITVNENYEFKESKVSTLIIDKETETTVAQIVGQEIDELNEIMGTGFII